MPNYPLEIVTSSYDISLLGDENAEIGIVTSSYNLDMVESSYTLDLGEVIEVKYPGGDVYDGDYVVVPKTESQVLPTRSKVMANDVTVKEVPFFQTSNTYGDTVYIASEV